MKLFVQIEIGDWHQSTYQKPWLHFASSLSSDMVGADLDCQSEIVVAEWVLKLMEQADHLFLLIQSHNVKMPLGAAQKVILHALKSPKTNRVVLSGNHSEVETMTTGPSPVFVKQADEEEIREMIKEFAQ